VWKNIQIAEESDVEYKDKRKGDPVDRNRSDPRGKLMEKGTKTTEKKGAAGEPRMKRRLPRVERRRERARKRILEIATERFVDVGLDRVRLEDVADEADISRATLYSHFASKEEILREVIRPVLEELIKAMKEKKAGTAQQGLDNLIEVYTAMWDDNGDALTLALRYILHDPGDLAELVTKIQSQTDSVLRPLNSDGLLRMKTDLARNAFIQTAIVLLDVLKNESNREALFRESIRALVLKKG
jgi:AcrR family transcriptional regulator